MITDWKKKKVAILGCGVEGVSTARYLTKKGASVYLLDRKEKDAIEQGFVSDAEAVGVQTIFGKDYLADLSAYDVIVRSPGVKQDIPELLQAEKEGVVLTSQTQFFFEHCPAPIIGVTGTKGKGTTSSLIAEMLKAAGKDVHLGGNIGVPPLDFLDILTPDSVVVLELSSFQLADLGRASREALTGKPHIAVMLMITSEHLDYHRDVLAYVDAKRNLLRFQSSTDFTILNRDYPASNESDVETNAQVFFVSRERETDNACFIQGEKIVIRRNGNDETVLNTDELSLLGRHNLENVCAATMAAKLAGVTIPTIASVLKVFTGLPHRLELVREIDGVKYYNDSFSTTPETAIAAIESFTSPEILILGGATKKSDFSELGKVIREATNIKAIIGIGDEWEAIKSHISPGKSQLLLVEDATTMEQVVQAAVKIAEKNDVVLLSPACASFGMFRNYKDRGEQFKKAVNTL